MRRNRSTPELARFWDLVEAIATEVDAWSEAKRRANLEVVCPEPNAYDRIFGSESKIITAVPPTIHVCST